MKEITIVEDQVAKAREAAAAITTITSPSEYEAAAEFGKKVSKLAKMIDTKEKSITKPINDSLKEIKAMFKPYKSQVEDLKNNVKSAMTAYVRAEEVKRQAAEAKIAARVEKGTMREDTAVAKLSTLEESAADTTGTLTSVLTLEVVDITQIPHDYLLVNVSAIKAAYRDGVTVPGTVCRYEKVARL